MDFASVRGQIFDWPEAEFLDENQTKFLEFSSLRVTVTSTALPWAEISISSNSHNLLQVLQYNVKEKRGKPEKK